MRRTLRVIGVLGVIAATSYWGPLAHANASVELAPCSSPPAPTGSPSTSPTPAPTSTPTPQNCFPAEGSRIVGTQSLQFTVKSDNQNDPIRRVEVAILSQEQGIPSANDKKPVLVKGQPDTADYPQSGNGAKTIDTLKYDWDSVVTTPYNGIYQVRVRMFTWGFPNRSDTKLAEAKVNYKVDNPPKAVGAPRIVAKSGDNISLEWDKATEPDVLSYAVYRAQTEKKDKAPPYSEFKAVGNSTEPSFRDDAKGEGTYWYTVIVTRRSVVTPETGISSAPSAISAAAVVGGEDGGSNNSGSGGGNEVVFHPRVVSKLPHLTVGSPGSALRPPPVPDAPFSAYLPYDVPEGGADAATQQEPGGDPRGAVLPVAVGAFLVSSALALGRMPY